MAVELDKIRGTAERVAGSHGLEIVDLEFSGNMKSRTLRVFLEKDEAGRAELVARAAATEGDAELPKGVPAELLSGVTHEDCARFAQDFGVVLDVEDLVPGAEYTLEVSSPGLERKLASPRDFARFVGSLVKLQTAEPVRGNRHWQGRLKRFDGDLLQLDLAAVKQKGKARKATTDDLMEIAFGNVQKANLLAEV